MTEERRRRWIEHTCHAIGCDAYVPPRVFMCRAHWGMLPKELRDAVSANYSPGQEIRMDPSPQYLNVAMRAVRWLGIREGKVEVYAR